MITTFVIIWVIILGITYKEVAQHDSVFVTEIHNHARHTAEQIQGLLNWFEEKKEVFVPLATSEIKNPTKDSTLTASDGRMFTTPLPIALVARLKNQISDGVTIRFISNTPINPVHQASNADNIALITALESNNRDFFEFNESTNKYYYVRPVVATKSCLTCHTNITEGDFIGGIVIDTDPDEFIHTARLQSNTVILMTIALSFIVMLVFYILAIYMIRRDRRQIEKIQLSQQMTTNMSQEIELVLGSVGHILTELKQGNFDSSKRDSLVNSLQNINKNLLDTSFKVQADSVVLRPQEEVFHVEDFFDSCMQMFHAQCVDKNIAFTLNIDNSVPTHLLGNSYHLRQILVRLIKNSVLYTAKGSINIRVSATTQMSSRFNAKDLNHLPLHLTMHVEDTSMGYVVTDKQHLLESFAKVAFNTKKLNSRPVISLTPINEIAMLLNGGVSLVRNSREGACFKATVQMKLVEESFTTPSIHSKKQPSLAQTPEEMLAELQPPQTPLALKQATLANLPPLGKEISIIIANSDIDSIEQEHYDIWKKEKFNITHIRKAADCFPLLDKAKHGFSAIFLRKLADVDIVYAATRIRYVEQTHPENPPIAIILIADEIIKTDMEALRFFNISSVDHVPRDPFLIMKLTKLALFTHKNKIFQGDNIFDETTIDERTAKYFDSHKALAKSKGDRKLLHSICSMWIRFYPSQLERLDVIQKSEDPEDHLRLVRSIKNSANTVSLPMLWIEANRLEKRLLQGKTIRYEKLLSIYERTFTYMKELFS